MDQLFVSGDISSEMETLLAHIANAPILFLLANVSFAPVLTLTLYACIRNSNKSDKTTKHHHRLNKFGYPKHDAALCHSLKKGNVRENGHPFIE